MNVEEVARGLRTGNEVDAARLIEGLTVLTLGADEGLRAGSWRRAFASRAVTLSQPDCLIAAAALTAETVLATSNPKDFPMEEIRVEHWPVGR